ncbi:hypothetical protein O9993_09425 [Vibrio lentus]|nr:hypothetical protein [Vibrio lentus]
MNSPLINVEQGCRIDFDGMEQQIIEHKSKNDDFRQSCNQPGRVDATEIEQVIEIAGRDVR